MQKMAHPFSFYALVPELKVDAGHHYFYHGCVQKIISHLGGKASVYVNASCTIPHLKKGWVKWFRRSKPPRYNPFRLLKLCVDFSKLFLSRKERAERIFFYESFSEGDFLAFACAALLFAKKSDHLWTLYRHDPLKRKMKLQLFLGKVLKKSRGVLFLPLADCKSLIHDFEKALRAKVVTLPHYQAPIERKNLFTPLDQKAPIRCIWPGGPREEKGLFLIQKVGALKEEAVKRFSLILSEEASMDASSLRLIKTKSSLDREEYLDALCQSDVVLLPYEQSAYQRRTSGVLVEAIVLGKVPLVLEGTWLAREMRSFGLEALIVDWKSPLFFSRLLDLLKEETLYHQLQAMQEAYLDTYSEHAFTHVFRSLLPKHFHSRFSKQERERE